MTNKKAHPITCVVSAALFCASANATSVVTNFWQGGDSAGGGWATAENWSEGVPASGQVVAFRNENVVTMNSADFATAKKVDGIDLQGDGTTLYLPQDDTAANTFPAISLGDGTVLFTQFNKNTTVKALNGSGTVTNTASAMRILTIGEAGSKVVSDFSGKITGRIGMNNTGFVRLTGTESTTPDRLVVLRNKDADAGAPLYGVTEVLKFGNYGDASSSIGRPPATTEGSVDIRFSGWLRYIGPGDESTDRYIAVRYLTTGGRAYPNTLDAGPNGGLTFTGTIETTHDSGNVGRMVLTGSNSVPCVIAGEWKGSATHVTKRGPGTWRFADNAKRNFRAGLAVEEGTLQFDSIAETNVVCSLGLATTLQKPYQGAYNAANNVDYAYLLGGDTTNVVFEYTGDSFCKVTTRHISLKGSGARLKSSSPTDTGGISLSGVSAQEDGAAVKTLWLAGANMLSCVGEISDGDGKVGVTKEDPGTWTLIGNQTFSGPVEVKEGTLVVRGNRPFTWYRFTVRGLGNQVFFLNELGLFNDAGERQTVGVTSVYPPSYTGPGYQSGNLDYHTLLPGQAGIATSKSIYYYAPGAVNDLAGLFDGTTSGYWRSAISKDYAMPKWNDPSNWIPIVIRLPEAADEAVYCDIVAQNTAQSVTAFSLDGSVDGETWTTNLLAKMSGDYTITTGTKWVSDSSPIDDSVAHIPGDSWKFVGHETNDWHQLENVSGVNVSPGATLKADGYVTLHRLTLDAANGNGTIDGFDFAETGFVDVTNVLSVGSFDVAVALSNLPDGALARLNGWSARINGRAGNSRVVFDGLKATVTRPGFKMIVR